MLYAIIDRAEELARTSAPPSSGVSSSIASPSTPVTLLQLLQAREAIRLRMGLGSAKVAPISREAEQAEEQSDARIYSFILRVNLEPIPSSSGSGSGTPSSTATASSAPAPAPLRTAAQWHARVKAERRARSPAPPPPPPPAPPLPVSAPLSNTSAMSSAASSAPVTPPRANPPVASHTPPSLPTASRPALAPVVILTPSRAPTALPRVGFSPSPVKPQSAQLTPTHRRQPQPQPQPQHQHQHQHQPQPQPQPHVQPQPQPQQPPTQSQPSQHPTATASVAVPPTESGGWIAHTLQVMNAVMAEEQHLSAASLAATASWGNIEITPPSAAAQPSVNQPNAVPSPSLPPLTSRNLDASVLALASSTLQALSLPPPPPPPPAPTPPRVSRYTNLSQPSPPPTPSSRAVRGVWQAMAERLWRDRTRKRLWRAWKQNSIGLLCSSLRAVKTGCSRALTFRVFCFFAFFRVHKACSKRANRSSVSPELCAAGRVARVACAARE